MSRLSQSLKRFLHNLAAGSLGQVINLCSQVIAFPLFLHYWSKPAYGEWLVLTSIPSLLWCFEGGLAGVASSRMTVAAAADDWHLASVLFQNVLVAQTLLCTFILMLTVAFVQVTDVSHFFHFSHTTSREASGVLVLMIGYMIFGFFINLLRAAYRASEVEARGLMVINIWRTVDLLVTILVLACGGHTLVLAAGLSSGAGLCLLLTWLDVRRTCPRINFGIREASWRRSKELMIDGAPLLAGMAASALSLQGYPLIVNRILGASLVVNLTAVRTVSRIILQAIQLLSNSSAPELSRTYGRKDTHGYLRLLKIIVAGSFLGGLLSCVCLPLLGPWVMAEWTGGKVSIPRFTLFLFGITIALQGAWGICAAALVASNVHHTFNYIYVALTAAALAAAPYFMLHYGFGSIPAVMIVADLSLLTAGVYLCHRKLKHVSLHELYRVFNPLFYVEKAASWRGKRTPSLPPTPTMPFE